MLLRTCYRFLVLSAEISTLLLRDNFQRHRSESASSELKPITWWGVGNWCHL